MKKGLVLIAVIFTAVVFQFCSSSKKATNNAAHITYTKDVSPLVALNCTPCHFPPKGNKKPLDTYAAVKEDIDEIVERIQKNPGEKGFMPLRHPKLSDSTINVFVQWKKDGLREN